jgi:hypothetical protein
VMVSPGVVQVVGPEQLSDSKVTDVFVWLVEPMTLAPVAPVFRSTFSSGWIAPGVEYRTTSANAGVADAMTTAAMLALRMFFTWESLSNSLARSRAFQRSESPGLINYSVNWR